MMTTRTWIPAAWGVVAATISTCLLLYPQPVVGKFVCSGVKYTLDQKGINHQAVPTEAVPGEELLICDKGMSCCTSQIERALHNRSKYEFERLVNSRLEEMGVHFTTHHTTLETYILGVLRNARESFHAMFVRTYGTLYEENAVMFRDMFDFLDYYYATGKGDIDELMQGFFDRLYRKMFQVLNTQYRLDDAYLDCACRNAQELKPFGDVPRKLTQEVKRSFTATRVYFGAIHYAVDFLKFAQTLETMPLCSQLLMKMTYCPYCNGRQEDTRACPEYCHSVVRECLTTVLDLQDDWKRFIDALNSLMTRLTTSFNIETVMEPISIKVSEGVMNFQEKGPLVSKAIFKKCGQPRLGKRDVGMQEKQVPRHHPQQQQQDGDGFNPINSYTLRNGTSVQELLESFRTWVKKAAFFWSELPRSLCEELAGANVAEDNNCWNGSSTEGGVKESKEIFIDEEPLQPKKPLITRHISALKHVSDKLTQAYNGLDVVWENNGLLDPGDYNQWDMGSGSGFGDGGSGSGLPDQEGDEGDDEDEDDDDHGLFDETEPTGPPHTTVSYLPPVFVPTRPSLPPPPPPPEEKVPPVPPPTQRAPSSAAIRGLSVAILAVGLVVARFVQ